MSDIHKEKDCHKQSFLYTYFTLYNNIIHVWEAIEPTDLVNLQSQESIHQKVMHDYHNEEKNEDLPQHT